MRDRCDRALLELGEVVEELIKSGTTSDRELLMYVMQKVWVMVKAAAEAEDERYQGAPWN